MDAKERLRLYLEQRRELGETELVLDEMPVEDLLALIGAKAAPLASPRPAANEAPRAGVARDAARPVASVPDTDVENVPRTEPVAAPPRPESRISSAPAGDWRETLRAAAAGPASSASGQHPVVRRQAARRSEEAPWPDWLASLGIPLGLSVTPVAAEHTEPGRAVHAASSLETVAELVRACTACGLHQAARSAVSGEGPARADLFCVGEAPGEQEDRQGRPFVGDAGQLLTKILGAIQLSREDVFIANVLKHRPPGNRDPLPEEVAACLPLLQRQLVLVQPKVILALGRFAAQSLLGTTLPIGSLRGQLHRYHGIPVIVTYHPAALLRNEQWKRPTWEDVKVARRILDAAGAATRAPADPASA